MRRPRGRRLLVAGVVAAAALFACAYLVLALLNRNAPPPPSFARPVESAFDVRLDGRWYDRRCRLHEIVGGWLLSAKDAPVDLTRLRVGEPPIRVSFGGEEVAVSWPRADVLRLGSDGLRRSDGARDRKRLCSG